MFRFTLFIAAAVVEAARITQTFLEETLHSADAEQLSNLSAPACGNNPEPKDYFFDLPGRTVDDSAAVRLIRNPSDPWLEVSDGAVWNVKADVDGNGKVIPSSILFEGRDKHNQQKRPNQYNLKSDMLYIKKRVENGVMWVEVKLKGCGAGNGPLRPSRPTGPARGGKETLLDNRVGKSRGKSRGKGKAKGSGGSRGSRGDKKKKGSRGSRGSLIEEASHSIYEDDAAAFVEVYDSDEEESALSEDATYDADDTEFDEQSEDDTEEEDALIELFDDDSDHSDTAKGRGSRGSRDGKGKGKGSRGSRDGKGKAKGARGRRPPSAGAGPLRPSRAGGPANCKPLTFAHGTFYPQDAVKNALQNEFKNGQDGGWIKPSQEINNVSMQPSLGKGIFGVLGLGTLGALAVFPVVWVGQEGGLAAGPIGALAGAVVSGGIAAYRSWKHRPKSASEKLYEKMYCLTKVKSCNGETCFKTCSDEEGNEVIVPTHSEPGEGIRC